MILILKPLQGMSRQEVFLQPCNNLKLVRLASLVKNKIYEQKGHLNCFDKSGTLEVMHLEIFEPDKCQTKQGLFLECIRNTPCAIHLPVGRWQFAKPYQESGTHPQKLMEILIRELQLEFEKKHQPQRAYSNGTRIGCDTICIWSIRKVGQNVLEKAVYKEETEYMNAQHAKAAWKALITE